MKMTAEDWHGRTAPGTAAETVGRWRLRNWSCNKWPLAMQGTFWLVQSEARPYCSCATRRKALPPHRHAGPAHGFGGAFSLVRDECGFAHADRRVAEIVRHLPSLLGFSRGLASYPHLRQQSASRDRGRARRRASFLERGVRHSGVARCPGSSRS
jgi:hypothetical protein